MSKTNFYFSCLIQLLQEYKIKIVEQGSEYRFFPERKWRFDYYLVFIEKEKRVKVAIEIEGGVWKTGRHNRPIGYIQDLEKYNKATILGWKVLRYTPKQFQNIYPVFNDIYDIYKKIYDEG